MTEHAPSKTHHRPLDTWLFILINAATQWLGYGYFAWGLIAAKKASASWGYFGLYTATLLLTIACVLMALTWLELRLRPKDARRQWSTPVVIGGTWIAWIFLIIDMRTFSMVGLHIYSPAVIEALGSGGITRDLNLGTQSWVRASLFALAGGLALIALHRACTWVARRGARSWLRRIARGVTLLTLIGWGLTLGLRPAHTHGSLVDQAMPFFDHIVATKIWRHEIASVHYPASDAPDTLTMTNRPDILWIQVESLRADHVGGALTPNLRDFAADPANHCLVGMKHYASAQTTERATFSLLYGLDAYHYAAFARDDLPSYPIRLLKQAGYTFTGFSATSLERFRGAHFIVDQFDEYREYIEGTHGADDLTLVELATQRLKTLGADPRFLFLFFYTTHHKYHYPPEFEHDTPVMPDDYDILISDPASPEERIAIYNRYRNSVRYLDDLFGRLMATLKPRLQRGELILVFTGDHGEEFWEHGLRGHSAPHFIKERGQVPLLICLPGVAPREVPISAHVDVWPTLLDYLSGGALDPQSYSQGQSLLHDAHAQESRLIVGLDFPADNMTACIFDRHHKLWMHLCEGTGFCLEPFRVTTIDDQFTLTPPSDSTIDAYVDTFHERRRRFATWRLREN